MHATDNLRELDVPRYPRLADYSKEELHLLAKREDALLPEWVTDTGLWLFGVPDAELEG